MKLNKLLTSKVGDILILDDFNALSQLGKAFEGEILGVQRFTHSDSSLEYTALEIECDDLEMTLIIKTIEGNSDIKMFTKFDEGNFSDFVDNVPCDHEETKGLPTGFILDPSGDDNEDEYIAEEPFPIYGFEKNGNIPCAIGEYTYNGEADSTYWAKYAWCEWYISPDPDVDDLENWHQLLFGWEVNINDIDILQG